MRNPHCLAFVTLCLTCSAQTQSTNAVLESRLRQQLLDAKTVQVLRGDGVPEQAVNRAASAYSKWLRTKDTDDSAWPILFTEIDSIGRPSSAAGVSLEQARRFDDLLKRFRTGERVGEQAVLGYVRDVLPMRLDPEREALILHTIRDITEDQTSSPLRPPQGVVSIQGPQGRSAFCQNALEGLRAHVSTSELDGLSRMYMRWQSTGRMEDFTVFASRASELGAGVATTLIVSSYQYGEERTAPPQETFGARVMYRMPYGKDNDPKEFGNTRIDESQSKTLGIGYYEFWTERLDTATGKWAATSKAEDVSCDGKQPKKSVPLYETTAGGK